LDQTLLEKFARIGQASMVLAMEYMVEVMQDTAKGLRQELGLTQNGNGHAPKKKLGRPPKPKQIAAAVAEDPPAVKPPTNPNNPAHPRHKIWRRNVKKAAQRRWANMTKAQRDTKVKALHAGLRKSKRAKA